MALILGSHSVTAEQDGVRVTVPNNDVARLMYYLNCVCVTIDCNNDPQIRHFTNYQNWSYLSIEEQSVLVALCYKFSPDVFDNRVFFHNDTLCDDFNNQFYTIRQVQNQLIASESIVIAGQTRQVNKIMTYKMIWMKTYYLEPMQRLVAKLNTPPSPPRPINYTSTTNHQRYTSPVINQPTKNKKKCGGCCKCCTILVVLLIIIGIGIGVFFILKQKGIIKVNF